MFHVSFLENTLLQFYCLKGIANYINRQILVQLLALYLYKR